MQLFQCPMYRGISKVVKRFVNSKIEKGTLIDCTCVSTLKRSGGQASLLFSNH